MVPVSERKYAQTSRKYALTSRKYALTSRKYARTSRKDLKEYCYVIFEQFSDLWLTPLAGVYNDTKLNASLDGQNRQSPIASDFGSRTQIAALLAILLYRNV